MSLSTASGTERVPSKQLDGILRSISRLRPLPGNATRILKSIDDPNTSVNIIADLISLDQALTAYVLRVANSAAAGYLIACASINDAVMRLGFNQVRSLVMSTIAAGPLSSRLSGYRLGDRGLWEHSLSVASAAHWLAGAIRYPDPEKAYIAGLLHDIGKLILDQYVQADYNRIVSIMEKYQMPLWQVEEQLFGIDHAGVGGYVTNHWQFPTELVDAIHYHHNPSLKRGEQRLAALVNLANAIIPQENSGELVSLEGRVVHLATLDILKLDLGRVSILREKLAESIGRYSDRRTVAK